MLQQSYHRPFSRFAVMASTSCIISWCSLFLYLRKRGRQSSTGLGNSGGDGGGGAHSLQQHAHWMTLHSSAPLPCLAVCGGAVTHPSRKSSSNHTNSGAMEKACVGAGSGRL